MPHVLLVAATGCTPAAAARFAHHIADACEQYAIDTRAQRAAFVAQCAHESALFTRTVESLRYRPERALEIFRKHFRDLDDARAAVADPRTFANRVYGGRMGNRPGTDDGWNFRGQGLIQLTGRDNVRLYALQTNKWEVLDRPWLLQEPRYAADSAGWFWRSKGCGPLADAGDWRALTQRINGGLNGYAERLALTKRALLAFGLEPA